MRIKNSILIAVVVRIVTAVSLPLGAQPAADLLTAKLLAKADEPVRIVCFGDSITGVYYHSGNRRAWPEMLQIALKRLYPKADLTVFNAGVSGHTSAQGLARIQRDVLDRKPHLVVVMFGMNDLAYGAVAPEQDGAKKAVFMANLTTIVTNCRAINAEVVLCTQNPVYPEAAPARPPERLGEYAALVRQTAEKLGVPVVDVYTNWEALRRSDTRAWRLLMSETIHPAMAGHKRMVEQIVQVITGRSVSLADVRPQQPVCAGFIERLKQGQPVTVMAPEGLVDHLRGMVLRCFPSAEVTLVALPDKTASIEPQAAQYKAVRGRKPDLVFVSLPPELLTYEDQEAFIRQSAWAVNWSLPFSGSAWSAVGVDPTLLYPNLTDAQKEGAILLREIVQGHDLEWIAQPAGQATPLESVLDQWFAGQIEM